MGSAKLSSGSSFTEHLCLNNDFCTWCKLSYTLTDSILKNEQTTE